MIEELLQNSEGKERARIKTVEIAKLNHISSYSNFKYGLQVEILSLEAIETTGSYGVEILAKASQGGKPLGFGKDGSVEIERFRIWNPPIMVDDPQGTVIRTSVNQKGQTQIRKLREDPIQAIKDTLAHTISVSAKDSKNVILGKVGSTTDTFFPDPSTGATTVDGSVGRIGVDQTWANIRSGAGNDGPYPSSATLSVYYVQASTTSNQWKQLYRSIFLFDTSSIPDTDTIDSGTFSIEGTSKNDSFASTVALVQSTPASNNNMVLGDYNQLVMTESATARITNANWSTTAYNDWTLNAAGKTAISVTGVSKFGVVGGDDLDNTAPVTWASLADANFSGKFADTAGTASDPKLVITHSAVAGGAPNMMMMGVGG